MAKIIVTGGAGFIGSHLVDKLLENHEVIIIDNLCNGNIVNPNAELYTLDICSPSIKPLFKDVDYVFHLAAIPRVPKSVEDPVGTSMVNIQGTVNVFNAAAEAKVKKVIFASSSSVYGEQDRLPLEESMTPNPISPYGLQKLVGEQFAKMFNKLYSLPIISLRYFNVYGPRLDFDSDYSLVVGKFIQSSSKGKPLTIYGDGEQTRGFSYVDDVVDANIKAMEKGKGGESINIGSKESYSVNYLANLIGGEKVYLPKRKGDQLHTKADLTLADKILGWYPKTSFEEGIKKTKNWYLEK